MEKKILSYFPSRQSSFCLLFLLAWAILSSCALLPDPRPANRLTLAAWNVDNLFDEVGDGDEYPEFDPKKGWTRAQFWHRCEGLSRVIRTLGDGGPDVLVLEEVEGAHALAVLRDRFLQDQGYKHSFLAPASVPGVKTAVLSRFPFLRTGLLFPSQGDDDETLRPLVEVEIDLGGRSLVVLGNHWKSRIPTPKSTEGSRQTAASLLRQRLVELEARTDRPLVLAVGDFNTSLELSRVWPNRALISGGVADEKDSGLVVFPGRAAARATTLAGAVWDPWEVVTDPPGSYFYQGDWNRLDHAFVAVSGLALSDWGFESFRVAAYAPRPVAYGVKTPDGVSDHFPLVLTLARVQH